LIKGLQCISTLPVDEIEAVLEKIRACGGKIKQPKRAITATG
jgi:predicted enzyme related to lactoylglutathione lyase